MLKINNHSLKIKYFPNQELLINDIEIVELISKHNLITIDWHFESCEELVHLIFIHHFIQNISIKPIKLRLPYLPFSRMDRQVVGQLFTLKYFGSVINELNFDSVEVFDLHSEKAFRYINNLIEITPEEKINIVLQREKVDFVFLPDKGAFNRYSPLIQTKTFWGEKVRNESTGRIEKYVVPFHPPLEGTTVLMVDDICSKGYTFLYALKMLKRFGVARVIIYVSHCEQSIFEGELIDSEVEKIYTTNSIMLTTNHEKIILI